MLCHLFKRVDDFVCPKPPENQPANTIKNRRWKIILYLLALVLITLFARFFTATSTYEIKPIIPRAEAQTIQIGLKGQNEAFKGSFKPNRAIPALPVLFAGVKNSHIISKLIKCESDWKNETIIDTNNLPSRGLLKFQDSTWKEMSRRAGIKGSPDEPIKAVLVADYMIEQGLIHRWYNCAVKNNLLAKK